MSCCLLLNYLNLLCSTVVNLDIVEISGYSSGLVVFSSVWYGFPLLFPEQLKPGAMKQILTAVILTICTIGHAAIRPVVVDPVKGASAANKTEVKLDELPAGVRKTLEGAGFTGWRPQMAYVIQQDKNVVYEVSFVRGEEHESLKLNEEGGKIE
jgi:hypothetical protein